MKQSDLNVAASRLLHDWTTWGDVRKGDKLLAGHRIGGFYYQERRCERCGKVQAQEVMGMSI